MTDFKLGEYRTRRGERAVVKHVDNDGLYGHVELTNGSRLVYLWSHDGKAPGLAGIDDLIPPPPPVRAEWCVEWWAVTNATGFRAVAAFRTIHAAKIYQKTLGIAAIHRVELIDNEVQSIELVGERT